MSTNPDANEQENGRSPIPATNAEIIEQPREVSENIKAGVEDILESLIEAAKNKFDDPKAVKRLSIPDLLEQIASLLKALKTSNVILSKNANVNLGQIQNYADRFNSADASRRKEIRSEVNRKLKRRPD